MARKLKFASGGSSKYDERYKRKTADIEKDYKIALAKGKNADVAKAKYNQRMADAKDDLAKWTKSDRRDTRAAEKAAESDLSRARKTGTFREVTPAVKADTTAKVSSTEDVIKSAPKPQATGSSSFKDAFRSARAAGDKTFTWRGKSYTTKMAGEGSAKAPAKAPAKGANNTTGSQTPAKGKSVELPAAFKNTKGNINLPPAPAKKQKAPAENKPVSSNMRRDAYASLSGADSTDKLRSSLKNIERERKLSQMAAAARKPGASQFEKDRYKYAVSSNNYAKGGTVKKATPKEGATGGASTVPMTPERKEFLDRMKKAEAESKKGVKPNPTKYAKGGMVMKKASKAGNAMKKRTPDTMGRAMMKKAGGGKCYAKGGSVSSRADGVAKKGKTKGKMV